MKEKKIISILGIQTELTPVQRNELRGLNADLLLRFSYYSMVFNGQALCLIQIKNEKESITPMRYKKMVGQIEAVVRMPVAVLFEEPLLYVQRDRLINQGVYFIVSDKYAFLPSLIVNAQIKRKEKSDKLTPAAQYLLLSYLLDEKAKSKTTIKDLEKAMPYNYVAMARAVKSLEDCGLCQTEIDNTGTKQILFTDKKRELWKSSQLYLFSPVKKTLYSDTKPEGNYSVSGLNALSHYSHLNPEQYDTLAVRDKDFNLEESRYDEMEGTYKIEIWKYPTSIPYHRDCKIVDKLSLYLSMKDDPDSRIEKELEIMIEEMKW